MSNYNGYQQDGQYGQQPYGQQGGYEQQRNYGQQGGHPQQGQYQQPPYDQQQYQGQQGAYPPQQGQESGYNNYPQQYQGHGAPTAPPYAPDYQQQSSFAPPQSGGFQTGQAPYQDPQQHGQAYGQQQPDYNQAGPGAQPYGDPNAPLEGDRGMLGAAGGAAAGWGIAHKTNQGFIGTAMTMAATAFAGSKAEDALKSKKDKHSSSSQYGGSSHGGKY
ncbi:hypothetical protein LTR27_007298 [Elasticomyces elasticus]|nr:hypothetical protein LTR27_007298 [Elasticomyces elasticus]